jgi:hypothetical protein
MNSEWCGGSRKVPIQEIPGIQRDASYDDSMLPVLWIWIRKDTDPDQSSDSDPGARKLTKLTNKPEFQPFEETFVPT